MSSQINTRGVKNGACGRFIPTHALNEAQGLFVHEYVANGGKRQKAASAAGYSNPRTEGYHLLNIEKIRVAIQEETAKTIRCEGASRSLFVMLQLLEPPTPANVRFQAARWILESAGWGALLPEDQTDNKNLA